MMVEHSLRDHQREASAAASGFADELEHRRLLREGWSEECLASERKFGVRVGRLYPLLNVPGGVQTPRGQGTLVQAFSSGCLVALTRGKKTGRRKSGERYRKLARFAAQEIEPYGRTR